MYLSESSSDLEGPGFNLQHFQRDRGILVLVYQQGRDYTTLFIRTSLVHICKSFLENRFIAP